MADIIRDLELSVRATNVLTAYGHVKTLDDFMALTEAQVMRMPRAGRVTWKEIKSIQARLRESYVVSVSAPPSREAVVLTARGIAALSAFVSNLAQDGFRIVTVIDTQNGEYHVVAQKEM